MKVADLDYLLYEHIDSVKYRVKIRSLFDKYNLAEKTSITNFCICFCFRDNSKYYLSNMPDWAIQWYEIGGSRSDEVFDLALMKNKNYYIPRYAKYDPIQKSLVVKEEDEHGYYDVYSLIRRHIDCTIILLALMDGEPEDPKNMYDQTKDEFENFCIYFLKSMLDEIKSKNSENKKLQILSDVNLLERVIKNGVIKEIPKLTEREYECIKLIKNSYPPKLIARTMNISEKSVRNYIDSIRRKLECNSTLDIYEKSIQYDL